MVNPVTCKVGDIDAADSSFLELNRLTRTHTSLESFTWVIELIHHPLPMKHLQEYYSDAMDIAAPRVRQWGVKDFL